MKNSDESYKPISIFYSIINMEDCNSFNNKNLSSVLSLKTELLRKKKDILRLKKSRSTCNEYELKQSELKLKKRSTGQHTNCDEVATHYRVSNIEDLNVLDESHNILQIKSQVYDQMASLDMDSDMKAKTLIAFERKSSINMQNKAKHINNDNEIPDGSVEYIDEFGRTRKCSLGEFQEAEKKDCSSTLKCHQPLLSTISNINSTDNDKEQEKRLGWEQKTLENSHKEELHYQDVFFDEARQHGVSYYSFSTIDTERQRQQKELESIRQKTLEEQANRSNQKAQLESIKSMRVLAAKNRKRARLGMPPISMDLFKSQEPETIKKTETNEIRPEAEHLQCDIERKPYSRPWDKNKIKSDWFIKSERLPFSQQEWNEHKRNERIKEFAPIITQSTKKVIFSQNNNMTPAPGNSNPSVDYMPLATIEAKLYQLRNSKTK